MFVGGSINMGVVQEEINSALWEYQLTETKWTTYPKSISLLIERQWKNQKNFNAKYIPIFYQKSNGNKFKINLETLLQFNLENNSVAMIRRQNHSETKSLNYNKCPLCLFKISPSAQICTICSCNIQEYMFKQYNNNNNNDDIKLNDQVNNNNNNKNNEAKNALSKDFVYYPRNINKYEYKYMKSDEIKCPFCGTINGKDFNFCVECSFDLREYHPKPVPVKDDNDNNNNNNGNNMNNNNDNINNNVNINNNSNLNNNNVSDDFDPFSEDFDGPDDSDRNKNNMMILNSEQPGSNDIVMNGDEGGEGGGDGGNGGGGVPGGAPGSNNNNLSFAENWH